MGGELRLLTPAHNARITGCRYPVAKDGGSTLTMEFKSTFKCTCSVTAKLFLVRVWIHIGPDQRLLQNLQGCWTSCCQFALLEVDQVTRWNLSNNLHADEFLTFLSFDMNVKLDLLMKEHFGPYWEFLAQTSCCCSNHSKSARWEYFAAEIFTKHTVRAWQSNMAGLCHSNMLRCKDLPQD